MSHVAQVNLKIKDLSALQEAADFLGFELRLNQKEHAWFGKWMDDWNSPRAAAQQGRDPETFGKCEHALRLKDHHQGDYEIGVVKNDDGTYGLVYDSWGMAGQRLEANAGQDLVKLKMEYGAAVAQKDLKNRLGGQGWYVKTTRDSLGRPTVKAVKQ